MFHSDDKGLPQQRESEEDLIAFSEISEGHDGQLLNDTSSLIACDHIDVTPYSAIPFSEEETLLSEAVSISQGRKAVSGSAFPAPPEEEQETTPMVTSLVTPEMEAQSKVEPHIVHEILTAAIEIDISSEKGAHSLSEEQDQADEEVLQDLEDEILQQEVSVSLQKDPGGMRLTIKKKTAKAREAIVEPLSEDEESDQGFEDELQDKKPAEEASDDEEPAEEEPDAEELAEEEDSLPEELEELQEREESFDPELLQLDEEELPTTYDEDRVVILIRDPYKAYAYWDISLEKSIELGLGESDDELPTGQLYLKVYRGVNREELATNPQIHIEIAIIGSTRSAYFDIDESFEAYYGKLEFVPFFDEPVTVSVSNIISPPPATLTGGFDEEWKAIEKIYRRFYTLVKKELEEDPLLKEIVIEEEMEKLEELTSLAGLDEIEELEELIREEGPEVIDRIEEHSVRDRVSREMISGMEPQERQNLIRKLKERKQEELARAEREISAPEQYIASKHDASQKYGIAPKGRDDAQEAKKEKISLFWIAEDLKIEKSERIRYRQEVLRRLVARYLEHRDLPGGMYGPVFPPERHQERIPPHDEVEGAS